MRHALTPDFAISRSGNRSADFVALGIALLFFSSSPVAAKPRV